MHAHLPFSIRELLNELPSPIITKIGDFSSCTMYIGGVNLDWEHDVAACVCVHTDFHAVHRLMYMIVCIHNY